LASAPSRARALKVGLRKKLARVADFAGLLAWRYCCFEPSLSGARESDALKWLQSEIPPYSRAAATACLVERNLFN
jgi:hypothetical protein